MSAYIYTQKLSKSTSLLLLQAAFEAEISSLDRELSLLRSVHETEGEGLNEELSALNVSAPYREIIFFITLQTKVCHL